MDDRQDLFPASYEASRARFRQDLDFVLPLWPEARLESYRLTASSEDLTIDWIAADPAERKQKLLVLTTGEHGIEAFVGSAALQVFIEEFLPRLDPRTTGLLLVHAINPWGFKHMRRVNRGNVDINRNFGWKRESFDLSANPNYDRLDMLLNPRAQLDRPGWERATFPLRMLASALRMGIKRFTAATLLGQYCYPRGIYYGGDGQQEESRVLSELYRAGLYAYGEFVLLDMHSGYGPRHPMTVVNSVLEPARSQELAEAFGYPRVVKSNPKEFYSITGDMIDYIYTLARKEFPGKALYAASFEFGTFGDSLPAQIRSLRATVFENRLFWWGARDTDARAWAEREYRELFAPEDPRWRVRAMSDARRAFEGILKAREYLLPG